MSEKRNIIKFLVVFLLLSISTCLMLYPFIANYLFENQTDSFVNSLEKVAEDVDREKLEAEIQAARQYNEILASSHVQLTDPFVEEELEDSTGEYNSLLCMTNDGVMGFVEIPCISVSLPIYHGTSSTVLEKGAGHLQGTSLPVGGENTHTVITGHTGLSSAKLFTDLAQLEEGDIFFLSVMGEKLAYEVDQIKVVEPNDTNDLAVVSGMDYCTLLTCTPYGVNSHRLLVRGKRTDYQEVVDKPETFTVKKTESKWMAEYTRAVFISIGCLIGLMVLLLVKRRFWKLGNREILDDFY